MKAAGLCGSDLHIYRQTAEQRRGKDIIPGHEPSGVVEELGAGVRGLSIGDRVAVYHYRGCGHCPHCLGGDVMWCSERKGYGSHVHGADAEFLLTDARNCVPLPAELSFAHGAFIACTAGTAYSAMRKLGVSGLDTIAVFGQGPVGLSGLLVARAFGAKVIAVEPVAERRALAEKLGADTVLDPTRTEIVEALQRQTGGEGVDMVFETSGSSSAREAAVEGLRRGGKAAFVGLGSREKTLDLSSIIGRQLTLIGSFVMPVRYCWDLARFIVEHKLPLEDMITHRFSLEEAPEAFRVFDGGTTGKVVLEMP
jgi:propanol-preferring alcohol dehydrogenase